MLEGLSLFQDIIEKAVNVLGYGGKCCQCFRIWWKVLSMFQDMVESAVNVSGYGGKCCQCCHY